MVKRAPNHCGAYDRREFKVVPKHQKMNKAPSVFGKHGKVKNTITISNVKFKRVNTRGPRKKKESGYLTSGLIGSGSIPGSGLSGFKRELIPISESKAIIQMSKPLPNIPFRAAKALPPIPFKTISTRTRKQKGKRDG